MTGRQDNHIQIVILDINAMIPQDHLLRRIKEDLFKNNLFGVGFYKSFGGKI